MLENLKLLLVAPFRSRAATVHLDRLTAENAKLSLQVRENTSRTEVQLAQLRELEGYRSQAVRDVLTLASATWPDFDLETTDQLVSALTRLTGTTLLEAMYILRGLQATADVPGDWCEYGVALGRTSALLAGQLLNRHPGKRLWLYDSFEGLPVPHSKDVLINDIYQKGSAEAYAGYFSFPKDIVTAELATVSERTDYREIVEGWITPKALRERSPEAISFAYLDMDFYQSTKDVLALLIEKMPAGGVAVIDDYGFFSDGVRIAVSEIMDEHPGAFVLNHPHKSKFAVLTKTDS